MPIGKLYQAPQISFTPVLNAGLNWDQLEQCDRDAFHGIGQQVKLRAGFRLYKFTAGDIESRFGVTPWWSPLAPYLWDSGLENRLKLAQHLGANPADVTRVVAAVRTNWNALTHILTAILLTEVYGFWGQVGWQPKFGDRLEMSAKGSAIASGGSSSMRRPMSTSTPLAIASVRYVNSPRLCAIRTTVESISK